MRVRYLSFTACQSHEEVITPPTATPRLVVHSLVAQKADGASEGSDSGDQRLQGELVSCLLKLRHGMDFEI